MEVINILSKIARFRSKDNSPLPPCHQDHQGLHHRPQGPRLQGPTINPDGETDPIPDRILFTWDPFKEDFIEKYVPETIEHVKEWEFLTLKQGKYAPLECDARRSRFEKYAWYIFNDPKKNVRNYIKGYNE